MAAIVERESMIATGIASIATTIPIGHLASHAVAMRDEGARSGICDLQQPRDRHPRDRPARRAEGIDQPRPWVG